MELTSAHVQALELVKATKPNIVGFSTSYHTRVKGGKEVPGSRCLRVYLSRKLPKEQLPADDLVPASIEDFGTDCVVIGEVSIASLLPMLSPPTLYTGRWETLISGISIGHPTITAGSLGAFVVKEGQDFMLSNWHVGVGEQGKLGDVILQPGAYDIQQVYGEAPSDKYAAGLLESFRVPAAGQVDAALVKPTRAYNPNLFVSPLQRAGVNVVEPHPVRLSGPKDPSVGMRVLKEGRTSGLTRGLVVDIDATLDVNYGGTIGKLTFQHLTVVQGINAPYLQGGDSGSVSREEAGEPERQAAVGLNFAGSSEGYGMAFKMSQVAAELGFTFAPGAEPPAPPAPTKRYAPSDSLEVAILVEALVPTRLSFFRTDRAIYSEGDPVALEGQLVEAATGAPVVGVAVQVNAGSAGVFSLTTDQTGAFRGNINGLPAGSYNLRAQFLGT